MTNQIDISIKNVSKNYEIYDCIGDRLKQFLWGKRGQYYTNFYALKDISFTVEKGETIGIIGHNGAGKSTLLEIISSIKTPTAGEVSVRGKIVTLLELGSGFHPDFTGRENVFIYGSVLGMSRDEIKAKFQDIAAFADIGDFIEQAVRTYSNGMLVRLAFSIAVHVDADILIFDEVLTAGDENFQYKCFSRIKELQEMGLTILLVSHSMVTITSLCQRVIILHQGRKHFEGMPGKAFWEYNRLMSVPREFHSAELKEEGAKGLDSRIGTGEARFVKTKLLDAKSQLRSVFQPGERCEIRLTFVVDKEITHGSLGILVQNHNAVTVYGYNTASDPQTIYHWKAGVQQEVSFQLELNLGPGKYFISASCNQLEGNSVICLCALDSFEEVSLADRLGEFGVGNLFATVVTHE
jgi:lipopolysaccharide transport system ATP-binding protein